VSGQSFQLDGDVAADIGDAEAGITLFNAEATTLTGLEGLARMLLRAEAVASSKIEGLEVGGRRLLHAEMARNLGDSLRDVTAKEVLGNIDAMAWALNSIDPQRAIEVDHILEIHRRLMAGTRLERQSGMLRTQQNWIGGGDYNPCDADYVPPPHDAVPDLMVDLCKFCNEQELPVLAQAAIAHAQFETIHPFVDGNGRVGRTLIHIVLRRRGLATRVLPPVSLILATMSRDYVKRLSDTRYVGAPSGVEARNGWNGWLAFFATTCSRAVSDARQFEENVGALKASWRERLGRIRSGSAIDLLIEALPGAPVVTVNSAASLIHRTFAAANDAIGQLAAASILHQVNVGRRNRAFEATEVIDAFNGLERQLASPQRDTRVSPPARAVPARTRSRP
jgi:Fic family protein